MKTIYKYGPGPSSSHTMGPYKAALEFKDHLDKEVQTIDVVLYGSLALTGLGHKTDSIIKQALENYIVYIKFDVKTKTVHPNTLTFCAHFVDGSSKEEVYLSLGGGSIKRVEDSFIYEPEIYDIDCFKKIYDVTKDMTVKEYVIKTEGKSIVAFLDDILTKMFESVERGLIAKGFLADKLKVKRVAGEVNKEARECLDDDSHLLKMASYAYAVAEENTGAGMIVTAPTCGSAGVLPAVLYYLSHDKNVAREELIEGLMMAGLVGLVVKHNATISGAVGGCQAEIGTATSMAAAALTYIESKNLQAVEYAAELSMEHSLGLTCDPVGGYVAIPCIERNVVGALKAYESHLMTKYVGKTRKNSISFDEVVYAMAETGNSLPQEYKETSLGGLANVHKC